MLNMKDRPVGLRLPSAVYEQLEAKAKELDVSVAWVIRRAILEYLSK